MMLTARSLSALLLLGSALVAVDAQAQVRWTADRKSSLAWWQINPHMNHLWATTCPEEPSWRPGEGRSGGWIIDRAFRPPKQGYAAVLTDTAEIPVYPRPRVRAVCAEAVQVRLEAADTVRWQGVTGEVVVRADALVGGENRRDEYARDAVLQTSRYPDIRFKIDSLVGLTRQADTLRATAVGVFTLHGVSQPMTAGVRAWPVAGGLRVMGRFKVPADDLVPVYGLSNFALGLGVGVRIWRDLYMGVDLLLRPEGAGGT
jgi:hypothetical protein